MKNLNLGSGKLHKSGYINVDIQQPADLILRVGKEVFPYKDGSIDRIEADNLLEHLDNDEFLMAMNECWRVLRKKGTFWFKVPDALRWPDAAFGDPTHKRYFTDRSFYYFTETQTYDNYGKEYGFKPWRKILLTTDNKFFTCELTPIK